MSETDEPISAKQMLKPNLYPISESGKDETANPDIFTDQPRKSIESQLPLISANKVHLTQPTIFGGVNKARAGASGEHHQQALAQSFVGSRLGSVDSTVTASFSGINARHQNGGKVRFLDRISWLSISVQHIRSSSHEHHQDHRAFLQHISEQDAHNLPGFAELFYSSEITIRESNYSCLKVLYRISGGLKNKLIYDAWKEADGLIAVWGKACCFRTCDTVRVGYSLDITDPSAHNSKLLTFKRSTHWRAINLDTVDTFYSCVCYNILIGRIDRTSEGFRLVDSGGVIHYRVINEGKQRQGLSATKYALIVINYSSGEYVAKVNYYKRSCFQRTCLPMRRIKHTIKWVPGKVDVIGKLLILGALFLQILKIFFHELHTMEKFVDLPLPPRARLLLPKMDGGHEAEVAVGSTPESDPLHLFQNSLFG